jgi:aminomethyltransferase
MTTTKATIQTTALHANHLEANGKMVDFAGWEMPIHYGSQIEEHHQVRDDVGMFDVSHMVILDFNGEKTKAFLQHLLANDVDKLTNGKALYSCMLNETGGIIDDLIVYKVTDNDYRMVINAACRDNDIKWIVSQVTGYDVSIRERDDLAMIAVQGPNARDKVLALLADEAKEKIDALKPFFGVAIGNQFFGRTGYTGEDGFEIMLPNEQAADLWNVLKEAGVHPIGLGARDTLRLEAGMNLYGTDMDETTSPWISGLGWTVALQNEARNFIGRDALVTEKENTPSMKLVGLVLEGRGVLRSHQKVTTSSGDEGEITSGTFSPTLKKAIAMARVPVAIGEQCMVEIRGKQLAAKVIKPLFVRHGKSCLES